MVLVKVSGTDDDVIHWVANLEAGTISLATVGLDQYNRATAVPVFS
jgi:hypothetical protein